MYKIWAIERLLEQHRDYHPSHSSILNDMLPRCFYDIIYVLNCQLCRHIVGTSSQNIIDYLEFVAIWHLILFCVYIYLEFAQIFGSTKHYYLSVYIVWGTLYDYAYAMIMHIYGFIYFIGLYVCLECRQ